MLFIGIDLAWSEKNNSGVSVIDGDREEGKLVDAGIMVSDEEIINYVSEHAKERDALIAIDAPLIVPNMEGRRVAEKLVGDLFRKYNAGAHPANRARLGAWSNGKIRGEELTRKLRGLGFAHDPHIKRFESTRKAFEVYPHPSMVVIFDLNKIIGYKARPNRTAEVRTREFERYVKLLKGLGKADPALEIGRKFISGKPGGMTGAELKRYEDTLDAIFCAYIAYYCWVHPEKSAVLGNMKEGYIMTPIFDSMRGTQKSLL